MLTMTVMILYPGLQIFDKALTEVTFTELYAELCVQLNAKLPGFEDPDAPATDGAKKLNITFRRWALVLSLRFLFGCS